MKYTQPQTEQLSAIRPLAVTCVTPGPHGSADINPGDEQDPNGGFD